MSTFIAAFTIHYIALLLHLTCLYIFACCLVCF